MLAELRTALRQLTRTPGFTALALLTLALGIGLNTAMFNVVNALVLRPVPLPELERLFRLDRSTGGATQFEGHRPAHFVAIAREAADVARLACSRPWSFTLTEKGRPPEVLPALRASAGYFAVLGVSMAVGREFRPEEDAPGRNQVVILSHAYWQSHYAGDPSVIGRVLRIDGQPIEIVGVAPAAVADSRILSMPDLYRPLAFTAADLTDRGPDHAYTIIGRYLPGVTPMQATARFATIATGLAVTDPSEYAGRSLLTAPLEPNLDGTSRQIVAMLVSLSTFVLLIACANLANLLLARALARTREFAIRGALGASRTQLVRPLVAECLLLAAAGGALGILLSVWTNDWMARQINASGGEIHFSLDGRLIVFALGASLTTAVFFGVAPAWLVSHVNVNNSLKNGTRGASGGPAHSRFRAVLISGQFALALVLLTGAVIFGRGVDQLLRREAGWNPAPLLRGVLSMPEARYPDTARQMQFYEKVTARVAALPGVAAVAICHELPMFYFPSGRGFAVEGQPPLPPGRQPGASMNGVTPAYFAAVGTRVIQGRAFSARDLADSPRVIVVSESMARNLFPKGDALGHRLAYADEKEPVWMEIVGIVEDVKFLDISNRTGSFQAYVPLTQATWSYVMLIVRAAGPAETLVAPVRAAISELDPDLAVKDLMPVPQFIAQRTRDLQTINQLILAFAGLGLFLAALGIYGVITRLVTQRTYEIGIRMALGAQVASIARLILGSGLRLVLIGAALGIVGAIVLTRFLAVTMPGISTNSVAALAIATLLLIATAALACWLPARRATRVNPITALRAE